MATPTAETIESLSLDPAVDVGMSATRHVAFLGAPAEASQCNLLGEAA